MHLNLYLAYSVTPLHVGVGRSSGIVDLPIARDPLGYPIIPSSGLKGALKNACASKTKCELNDMGRIDCEKCRECCCLYGHEAGSEHEGIGKISVLDFVTVAVPVPSPSHGWVYVTSLNLLKRLMDLLEAGGKKELMDSLERLQRHGVPSFTGDVSNGVSVLGAYFRDVSSCKVENNAILDALSKSGYLASELTRKLLIVPDRDAVPIINKGIMISWRIRLNLATKTVTSGALWSEEYIPMGTIFVGGLIESDRGNPYCEGCSVEKLDFKKYIPKTLIVGGKEGIGKGLVKLSSL